ncbi:hypothetical protein AHAS_Ahas07G0038700 [Arachis hypogaea]
MEVFTFVLRKSGAEWTVKQHSGDIEDSASSTYDLQRKLVNATRATDSSGAVQSSFSFVSPSSVIFQVVVGGAVFVGGAVAAAPAGGAAAENAAAPAAEKKEEKVEKEEDEDFGISYNYKLISIDAAYYHPRPRKGTAWLMRKTARHCEEEDCVGISFQL